MVSILCLATGCRPGSGKRRVVASGTFSALTYNVAGLPQGISKSNPASNTPQIGPKLNRYQLVLAQEDFVYHHLLTSSVQHLYATQPMVATFTLVNDGLNRFSRFPFQDFQRERWRQSHGWFNNGSDNLASKGFSVARHEVASGIWIDVYNLHAEAGHSTGDYRARSLDYDQLAAHIQVFSLGNPVIVGGDTNLRGFRAIDEPVFQTFLQKTGLRDSARHLNVGVERIDRFLFRSGRTVTIEPVKWRIANEFVTPGSQPLSDHLAIHVDFRWKLLSP